MSIEAVMAGIARYVVGGNNPISQAKSLYPFSYFNHFPCCYLRS